eukprot:TRINITY_DN11367_c0_g2_i2.p1 TRINITY_DN11367_c0_g2~~TRINITY_DN11367_c0_g2_i2.p1  ORF type:complete len:245 (+),score=42.23 TRINITY_DN11367_c0_g2_i2:65-799(+)
MCIRDRSTWDIRCWQGDHLIWVCLLGIPSILVWLIGAPIYLFFKLRSLYKENKLEDPHSLKRFGFLYYGYDINDYYWEFVIFWRKLLLVLSIIAEIHPAVKALTIFLILLLSYLLHISIIPFNSEVLNTLEKYSLISSATVIYAYIYYSNGNTTWLFFVGPIIFLSFLFFVISWGRIYITVMFNKVKTGLQPHLNKILKKDGEPADDNKPEAIEDAPNSKSDEPSKEHELVSIPKKEDQGAQDA